MEINIFPRWFLARLGIPEEAQPHWALFLSSLVALAAPLLLIHIPHYCLFRKLLGIPCPGCGILHAISSLLKLHVAAAWGFNPAALVVVAFLTFQLIARPVALRFASFRPLINRVSYCGSYVVLAALLFVWIDRLLLGGMNAFRHLS